MNVLGLCAHILAHQAILLCRGACAHLSQLSGPVLYVTGFLCTCFGSLVRLLCHRAVYACLSSLCLLSASRRLCALVLALQACPLHRRACVSFFVSPGPPSMLWGFFWLPRPTLCATRVLCTGEFCMLRLSMLGLSSLLWAFCRLLSVPQAHCVVEAMVHELFMG